MKRILASISSQADTLNTKYDALMDSKRRCFDAVALAVELLHSADLIWEDVKAGNILIDKEDKAWLIDFGGDTTEGWVDFDHVETKQGDLQGLQKLRQYLELEQYTNLVRIGFSNSCNASGQMS